MQRFDIINTIGDKYHVGNIEVILKMVNFLILKL